MVAHGNRAGPNLGARPEGTYTLGPRPLGSQVNVCPPKGRAAEAVSRAPAVVGLSDWSRG